VREPLGSRTRLGDAGLGHRGDTLCRRRTTGCKRFVEIQSGGKKWWVDGARVCCVMVVRDVEV
jgi:hypothetical protein